MALIIIKIYYLEKVYEIVLHSIFLNYKISKVIFFVLSDMTVFVHGM